MVSLLFSDQCFNRYEELNVLSNFYPSNIRYLNHSYKTAEHLYQTLKCAKEEDKKKIRNAVSPKAAKILGKYVDTKPDWDEDRKISAMRTVLTTKFGLKRKLMNKLLETGDAELIYLNYWHDTFWGVCACTTHKRTGQNQLGIELMKIRATNTPLKMELNLVKKFNRLFISKKKKNENKNT